MFMFFKATDVFIYQILSKTGMVLILYVLYIHSGAL